MPPLPDRRFWVGITDRAWYDFLRAQPGIDEVNFWMPKGSRRFSALSPGEPFLFKLHAPENFIVGGGFFASFSALPCSLSWEAFGVKNGAPTYPGMRHRIRRYRGGSESHLDYEIGCIVLVQPFFFDEEDWIPAPLTWAPNIVQGKTLSMDDTEGRPIWDAVAARLTREPVAELIDVDRPMFGAPSFARRRLGQGAFRVLITDTYDRRCAATGEKALPVLEAAHILAVGDGGQHRIDNGLLLRSDLHRLYDHGYLTVTPDHRIRVSSRLRSEFGNGEIYYPLDGQPIRLPRDQAFHPNRDFLAQHSEAVFVP